MEIENEIKNLKKKINSCNRKIKKLESEKEKKEDLSPQIIEEIFNKLNETSKKIESIKSFNYSAYCASKREQYINSCWENRGFWDKLFHNEPNITPRTPGIV